MAVLGTPASALDLPTAKPQDPASHTAMPVIGEDMSEHSRWRRHRHRDRIDAGDILTGVLIIGGIAAIAGAARNDRDGRDDRYRTRYPDYDNRYDYNRRDERRGLERAARMCANAADARGYDVETVDEARRGPGGWTVSGETQAGARWSCRIDNNGRVTDISGGASAYRNDRPQWQDDGYGNRDGNPDRYWQRDEEDWQGGYSENSGGRDFEDRQYDDEVYLAARRRSESGASPAPAPASRSSNDYRAPDNSDDGRYGAGSVGDFE